MFRIRQQNWEAFVGIAQRDFEGRMVVHLRKFYPSACTTLGDAGLLRLIRYGIERARFHGFTSERATCIYIDVMLAFGVDFDRNSGLPWVNLVLSRKNIQGPRARMLHLFAEAREHQHEAHANLEMGGP